jgi:hypothetical protein
VDSILAPKAFTCGRNGANSYLPSSSLPPMLSKDSKGNEEFEF